MDTKSLVRKGFKSHRREQRVKVSNTPYQEIQGSPELNELYRRIQVLSPVLSNLQPWVGWFSSSSILFYFFLSLTAVLAQSEIKRKRP